jgi:hypothetical protein
MYNCDKAVVESILRRCLDTCSNSEEISTVVLSPLGTGYGDLEVEDFIILLDRVLDEYDSLTEVILCCDSDYLFGRISKEATKLPNWKQGSSC